MIFLYLILIILLILLAILFIPISVKISYTEKLQIDVSILGIKMNLGNVVGNSGKNKDSKKAKKSKNFFGAKNENKFSFFEKNDILKTLDKISKVLSITKDAMKKLVKNISVKIFRFNLKIGSQNAADTAIRYGQASAFLYPLLEIIKEVFNPQNFVVNVVPDFLNEKIEVNFECEFRGNIFDIISVLMFVISRCYKCNII